MTPMVRAQTTPPEKQQQQASPTPAYDALSPPRRAFVDHYLACGLNAAAAYRLTYPNAKAESAETNGPRLIRIDQVGRAVRERMSSGAMQADEVLYRLAEHARGSLADVLGGTPRSIGDVLQSPKAHLVKSVAETQHGIRVEIYDAQAALEKIGKHLGLFVERHEHTGKDGVPLPPIELHIVNAPRADGPPSEASDG